MDKMTESRVVEAQAQGGGEVVAEVLQIKEGTAVVALFDDSLRVGDNLYTAPPSAPVGVEEMQRRLDREESDHGRTIDQRDAAEDALGRMFQAVTGRPAEWSSAWGYVDAIEEVEEHVAALAQQPAACDMGALCVGCEPHNADGTCPGQQPSVVPETEESVAVDTRPTQAYLHRIEYAGGITKAKVTFSPKWPFEDDDAGPGSVLTAELVFRGNPIPATQPSTAPVGVLATQEDRGEFCSDTAALAFLRLLGDGNLNVERAVERLRSSLIALEAAREDASTERRALLLLAGGDSGASSKAICHHMLGMKSDGSFPWDPSDLGRCLRFLERFPEWKPRMGEMARYSAQWAALVERWDELAEMMADEVGIDWSKDKRAPLTYAAMKDTIDQARGKGIVPEQGEG